MWGERQRQLGGTTTPPLIKIKNVGFSPSHSIRAEMWQAVLSDPQEREAFHSLLSDYFDSRPQLPTFTPPSRSQPAPTPIALPPRTLPPPALAPRASSSYSNSPAPSSPHEAPGRSLPAGLVQTQGASPVSLS